MLRRIASIIFIAIALISFIAPSSYAQDNYRHGRRSERRVYIEHRHEHRHWHRHIYRRAHRERRNKVIIRDDRNRVGVKVKVNF